MTKDSELCPVCDGSGAAPGSYDEQHMETCPACGGDGIRHTERLARYWADYEAELAVKREGARPLRPTND